MDNFTVTIIGSVATGIVTTITTVKAMNVHIEYLKNITDKLSKMIEALESRVRELEINK